MLTSNKCALAVFLYKDYGWPCSQNVRRAGRTGHTVREGERLSTDVAPYYVLSFNLFLSVVSFSPILQFCFLLSSPFYSCFSSPLFHYLVSSPPLCCRCFLLFLFFSFVTVLSAFYIFVLFLFIVLFPTLFLFLVLCPPLLLVLFP